MVFAAGARLGSYDVIAPLGAGGMGEVYRARDSRLNREVAIKTLPEALAADHERVARFEREARLLAALNHPSIATIYGLERSGSAQFIILELVEGGTLADRLKRGPLPTDDALRIARDVADALHAAHDKGIIHRDLKPANIALTPGGRPKVLDFGLAKAFAADSTATTIDDGTRAGVLLGTLPYMSPEQARGRAVDKRSDVWAFGCVVYEMLTGRSPFAGPSGSDVVAAILQRDPEFAKLPEHTPARVRWLLRRCLEKDPDRRLHDIADARIELDDALASPHAASEVGTIAATPRMSMRERAAWVVAALAIAGIAAVMLQDRGPVATSGTGDLFRSSVLLPDDLRLTTTNPAARFALSPDGRRLALVAANAAGVPMLWIRPLDSLTAQPIPGTEGASFPFWSPDGRSLAFMARIASQSVSQGGRLLKIDLSGGQPVTLAEAAFNASGAWGPGNVILFTPTGNSPLFRLSASSPGEPVAVTTLDTESGDVQHSFPSFLPDGRHFLFTALGSRTGANEARAIYLGSLDGSAPPRMLIEAASHGQYANGHVLFLRDATLLAQRIDLETLTVAGEAIPIAEGVQITTRVSGGTGAFSVSDKGVLVYQTGLGVRSQLTWTDRAGRVTSKMGEQADYGDVVLSPDGSRALVSALDPQLGTRDLLIYDVVRGVRERFAADPSDEYAPVWSPDGARVAFTAARDGAIEIYERSLSGAGGERKLDSGGSRLGKFAATWSRDGHLLFIAGGRALARSDIHVVSMTGASAARPLLESPAVESQVRFSPDGRWIAYAASDSGRMEVYVAPFPGPGAPQRVSINGGGWPHWRRDSREIFFLAPGTTTADYTLMAAPVTTGAASLKIGDPASLFAVRLRPMGRLDAYSYDVAPDGRRFLFNMFVEEAASTGLTLVVNWPGAIK
jgi:serine/threonine protein kinase/dipeptidyl aminopeptidase/acylaminoacyl peptidase